MFKTQSREHNYNTKDSQVPISSIAVEEHHAIEAMERLVTARVALAFGLPPDTIQSATRGVARVALARQVSMYLLHVALGFTLAKAGGVFGRDRTTAAHACRVVEDLRDNVNFDRQICELERFIQRAVAGQCALRDVLYAEPENLRALG
ncbi:MULTISPECIES: helix-turn-helix domain-containing protein [Pseudovibrio]|uniref:helix-turn-helix domain-containing protein n=1 Tax=Stappiaceae TaxID=2821832 RepID=UPI002365EDEB|nr:MULTISPECIES: helix-turn-helix domain-containing protein [Pseudovibrio]MDD7909166.1 helix-turn-helix domain-containing protein [Pseudovibrio exalbescens]MDX5595610.1 helix-turn-helix domain-containing protein [Pseudovibrio sp. SPO723]